MKTERTDFGKSVTGVVLQNGKVLLARHTYGGGKGKYIVPGGYLESGESPENALIREYMEETGIQVKPQDILGIRFNQNDWYVAFLADYVSGEARSDQDENDDVVWMDIAEALSRDDVPDLTKKLIESAVSKAKGLKKTEYQSSIPKSSTFYSAK